MPGVVPGVGVVVLRDTHVHAVLQLSVTGELTVFTEWGPGCLH